MSKKVVVKAYFFNWAGGTSRIYSPLHTALAKHFGDDDNRLSSRSFVIQSIPVDLPGRLVRSTEHAITDIPELAASLIKELFSAVESNTQENDEKHSADHMQQHNLREPFVLFGHSYGSILAFEIAKQLEERKMQGPIMLFVSASRPPSSTSLTSYTGGMKPVSEMNFEEMVGYFQCRGSTMTMDDFGNDDLRQLFVNSVRVDYKGLEEYISNDSKVSCPICAIGGDQDAIVSPEQISQWRMHQRRDRSDDEGCEENKNFNSHILKGRGHFYLNDSSSTGTPDALARIFVEGIENILGRAVQGIVKNLVYVYSKVLNVEVTKITIESDFFKLGGSSLDTITLIAQIKSSLHILVTQDIIFLNPQIKDLALRIKDIQSLSMDAPTLVAVEGSDVGGILFPASHGQEQMISCWEMSPTMYNMPTTIEFNKEGIDIESFHSALSFVVSQQPSLRTVVKVDASTNRMSQYVFPVCDATKCFDIKVIDAKNENDARLAVESESGFIFPLYEPPIVRAVVVRIQEGSDLLLLNQHHVGSDGWSRAIFRRQLLKAYTSMQKRGKVDDADLFIPSNPNYVDWTIWSQSWLVEYNQQEKQLDYWKNKLNALPALDLPTDYTRPTVLSSRGVRLPIIICSELVEQLTSFVVGRGASLYAGLISLYVLMLHRMGGGDDFCIGIALANRHHEGLQNLIGYFANEVAIRAEFDQSLTFAKLLSHTYQNILEGMAHSDTPFHKVTEALRLTRSGNRTAVFQAMFALQEREWHSVDDLCPSEGDLRFQLKQFNHNTSKFEVHLQLRHDGEGGLEGDLHIATDLFTEESGRRMVQMYELLMRSCVKRPDVSINFHDMTPEPDRLLEINSNNTAQCRKTNSSVFDFLLMEPKSVAICSVDGNQCYTTYGELKDLVISVAAYLLLKVRVKRRDRVGLLVKSSNFSLASIFGVIFAGCSIVVVDAEKTSAKRCQLIFEDAGVSAVIIDEEFLGVFEVLEKGHWTIIPVGDLIEYTNQQPIQPCAAEENDTFGIYYTSGSTGTPKGVIVTHGNVLNLVNWWEGFFDLNAKDNVLLFSSLSFIMSLRQYVPTLCAGGTLVIPRSSIEFETAIIKGKVNKLICTPSALAALDMDKVSHLIKYVQVAGEAPRLSTMVQWKSRIQKLFIGLGPTELCAHALCGEFDGKTVCIGHPAGNVKAYVVDGKSGIQCPVNVPGELWVAGKNVTNGYLNREELSNRHFCLDPFEIEALSRLYKTGDFAKRLPDGRIQFIGRQDAQLKVNGFRIEAGEIINAVPKNVSHAHVMIHEGKLHLFVAPKVDIPHVRKRLVSCLPSYMVPHSIHALDAFPLNKNRKLDSEALLKSISLQGVGDENKTQEMSMIERSVCTIWAQQLGIDTRTMGKNSNFFELGGTSLSAVMVSRALEAEFETEVGVTEVFLHQTVGNLAEFLSKSSDMIHFSGIPKPLHFLPGGRDALHPVIFSIFQIFGLLLMSIIVTVPIIGTSFLSIRSFFWFGSVGIFLFPAFLVCGCFVHLFLVILCKWTVIGRYQQGKARKFSWFFLKWWLMRRILQVPRLYSWILDETNLSGILLRILGASVGSNVSVEQPYFLEPDLVSIGDNCVAEFEVQFATSEIRNGYLELRKAKIGNNVKLGVRSVILGGAYIHNGSQIAAKTTVDFFTSTTEPRQALRGSPATIDPDIKTDGDIWRPKRGQIYTILQIISCFVMIEILTGIGYIGASLGLIIRQHYGSIGLVMYLGSLFPVISSMLVLLVAALLKKILMPFKLVPGKIYDGDWFAVRKWFLDRLFLSPLFSYCSQRTLQTSSTFPWYLRLLGAKTGRRAWLNHPYTRGVGTELINIGDDVHMGMLSYFSTDRYSKRGISFHPITIGQHSSFGQRCVCLSGVSLHSYVTVGAETTLPHDFQVNQGGTTFGSPPVLFTSNAQYKNIVRQSQHVAQLMLSGHSTKPELPQQTATKTLLTTSKDTLLPNDSILCTESITSSPSAEFNSMGLNQVTRMQDIGRGKYFWLYVLAMILIQGCIPVIIGFAYGIIFFGIKMLWGELRLELIIAVIPIIYVIGSILLMILMKVMHICGGSFKIGTANFFSFRFFYWHIFADVVYLCTSTIIYPFSGTEFYCIWLRSMGAKIGQRVFISPENGGFREIDFLHIGDDCCLMTPNIHGHYTDHGVLQFCPVKLENGCEINPGVTIMPLTSYGKKCCLRPFAVTVKGQHCKAGTEYIGNPCKALKSSSQKVAILFGGQGSQYPGMLDHLVNCAQAVELLEKAQTILGMDIRELSSIDSDPETIKDTSIAQPIVTVANLMAVELMRQKAAVDFSKVVACAGFSLGELSALCFAGAISFEDTLKLVKIRADAMAACESGAMCNLRGFSRAEVHHLCGRFGCSIANIICDHDTEEGNDTVLANNVYCVAGLTHNIDKLVEFMNIDEERGSTSAKRLRVSAAFHSLYMEDAKVKVKAALNLIDIRLPVNYLVYSNVTGRPYRSVQEIRKLLPLQITNPVQWYSTINDMTRNEEIDKFIECGPMDTLSKTVKLIIPDIDDEQIIWSDSFRMHE